MNQDLQPDFLYAFIEDQLEKNGFGDVDEETKTAYINRFLAELHRRLGVAVMPHLNEESAKELGALLESESVSPVNLEMFWKNNVTNFDTIVAKVLDDFSLEMKKTFADIKA